MAKIRTIHLEDHGQDFLEWDIDESGKVVDCRPCQAGVWIGCQVEMAFLEAGECPIIRNKGIAGTLKYKVIAIEEKEDTHV